MFPRSITIMYDDGAMNPCADVKGSLECTGDLVVRPQSVTIMHDDGAMNPCNDAKSVGHWNAPAIS